MTNYARQYQSHMKCICTTNADYGAFGSSIFCDLFLKTVDKWSNGTDKCRIYALIKIFLLVTDKFGSRQGNLLLTIQILDEINCFLKHLFVYIF